MLSLCIGFLSSGHCSFFKQKDSVQIFSTSTPISQDPVSLHLLKMLQQKNKEKQCVASTAARLNQHSYFEISGKISP